LSRTCLAAGVIRHPFAEPAIATIADIGRHVRQKPLQDVQHTVQQHSIQHRSLIICAFFSKSKMPA